MRAFKGNTSSVGQVPIFVGTSYDIVLKVHAELDSIMQMGTILEQTADFLFFHFDVAWGDEGRTDFTGQDKYGRDVLIFDQPMVYVNGVRVPQEELTVLEDGAKLRLANAVAPGDQVHIAAFGFNEDGTLYFHPLLAIDRLLDLIAEIEAKRDEMAAMTVAMTEQITAHQAEMDEFSVELASVGLEIADQASEVGNLYARAQQNWINAGFEQGIVGQKGVPYGWQGVSSDADIFSDVLGILADAPADSVFKSTKSFGSADRAQGRWWYISKMFAVSGGDRISTNFRIKGQAYLPGVLLGDWSSADFLDQDDAFLEVVSYDETGVQIEVARSRSFSQLYRAGHGGAAPTDDTWHETAFSSAELPETAVYAEVRLVMANGTGEEDSLANYLTTGTTGDCLVIVDDVTFDSLLGRSLVEISPSLLGSAIHAHTAIVNSQSASAHETAAGAAATAASEQAILAATQAAAAGAAHTQTVEARDTAVLAAATAVDHYVLSASAALEAQERSRLNYIGKSTFEDGELGQWGPQPGPLTVPAVPEPHPLGVLKALCQTNVSDAYYRASANGGWIMEDLEGRTLSFNFWVYNATDGAAEVGVEVVKPDNTTVIYTELAAGGSTFSWERVTFQLGAFPIETLKWRPLLRVFGTGSCYWTHLVCMDASYLASVEGVANAVIEQLGTVEAYVDEAGDYAAAALTQRVAAETAQGAAETAMTAAATSATNAAGSASSAALSATVAARASGPGTALNPIFMDWTGTHAALWSYLQNTGSFAKNTANAKYVNCYSLVASAAALGPRLETTLLGGGLRIAPSPAKVLVTVEVEWVSGGTTGCGILAEWIDSGTRQAFAQLPLEAKAGIQIFEVLIDRPATAVPGSATDFQLRFHTNHASIGTLVAKTVRLHRLDVAEVSAASLASLALETKASLDGFSSAAFVMRVKAGGASAGFEMVSASDIDGVASNIRMFADEILLNGSVSISKLRVGNLSNLVPNGNFDDIDAATWNAIWDVAKSSGGGAVNGSTRARLLKSTNSTYTDTGVASMLLQKSVADLALSIYTETLPDFDIPIQGNKTYYGETAIKTNNPGGAAAGAYVRIYWLDASKASISTSDICNNVPIPTSWVTYGNTFSAPATACYARVRIINHSTNTTIQNLFIDRVILKRKDGTTLIDDDGITTPMIKTGAVITEKLDVEWLSGERLQAAYLAINTLLTIENGAGFSYGKPSVASDVDGLYLGRDGASFGLAVSRTNGSKKQSLRLSSSTGLALMNARHWVTAASVPADVTRTTNLAKTALPAGIKTISLTAIGGGAAGWSVTSPPATANAETAPTSAGGVGGNTVVKLYDGTTLMHTFTAPGAGNAGIGKGSQATSGSKGYGKGEASVFGNGGVAGYYDAGSMSGHNATAATGKGAGGGAGVTRFDPGTTPVYTTPIYTRGGLAATPLPVDAIDVSSWASPQIEITIGAGGTAPASSEPYGQGGAGASGQVVYSYTTGVDTPADVVPLVPTTTGSFSKAASTAGSFPALGAGLWIIDTGSAETNMQLGDVTIAPGKTIRVSINSMVAFFASQTPTYTGGPNARTIYYQHFSMGAWG
jgi:hypothetical protein